MIFENYSQEIEKKKKKAKCGKMLKVDEFV